MEGSPLLINLLIGFMSFLGLSLVAVVAFIYKKQMSRVDYHAEMLISLGRRLDRVEAVQLTRADLKDELKAVTDELAKINGTGCGYGRGNIRRLEYDIRDMRGVAFHNPLDIDDDA